jgi:hypothetical protein
MTSNFKYHIITKVVIYFSCIYLITFKIDNIKNIKSCGNNNFNGKEGEVENNGDRVMVTSRLQSDKYNTRNR